MHAVAMFTKTDCLLPARIYTYIYICICNGFAHAAHPFGFFRRVVRSNVKTHEFFVANINSPLLHLHKRTNIAYAGHLVMYRCVHSCMCNYVSASSFAKRWSPDRAHWWCFGVVAFCRPMYTLPQLCICMCALLYSAFSHTHLHFYSRQSVWELSMLWDRMEHTLDTV